MAGRTLDSLCYLLDSTRWDEFIEFFKNGKKVGGDYALDPQGRKKVGVINWLAGTRQCTNVHFFTTPTPVLALVVTLPFRDTPLPWVDIAGFMDFVLKGTTTLDLGNGQFQLVQQITLEDTLAARCAMIGGAPAERVHELEAALRGDPGTNLDAILKDLGLTLPA